MSVKEESAEHSDALVSLLAGSDNECFWVFVTAQLVSVVGFNKCLNLCEARNKYVPNIVEQRKSGAHSVRLKTLASAMTMLF